MTQPEEFFIHLTGQKLKKILDPEVADPTQAAKNNLSQVSHFWFCLKFHPIQLELVRPLPICHNYKSEEIKLGFYIQIAETLLVFKLEQKVFHLEMPESR